MERKCLAIIYVQRRADSTHHRKAAMNAGRKWTSPASPPPPPCSGALRPTAQTRSPVLITGLGVDVLYCPPQLAQDKHAVGAVPWQRFVS
ncbi:hypothetical protein RRG08_065214 [Elysia crispata]|uniref:Uncharacterized protein n=1 Tax=Elysia crispata TaxID=231223 RepID=A0AAE0YHY3_9GAST|nr:hypothetical protein RRG08_065214 [Elysia crispata]